MTEKRLLRDEDVEMSKIMTMPYLYNQTAIQHAYCIGKPLVSCIGLWALEISRPSRCAVISTKTQNNDSYLCNQTAIQDEDCIGVSTKQ